MQRFEPSTSKGLNQMDINMKTLVISDRQPLLRLGLKLVIQANCQPFCFHEISNVNELSGYFNPENVSIIIIGLDLEYDKMNPKILRKIKAKFPNSGLIIYADNIQNSRLLSYYELGIAAHISKLADEKELVYRLRSVMDGEKQMSTKSEMHSFMN